MTDLEALAKLSQEATPGPWESCCGGWDGDKVNYHVSIADGANRCTCVADDLSEADAAYIAAASPDVVLALIEMLNAHHRGLTISGDGPEKCAICAGLNR